MNGDAKDIWIEVNKIKENNYNLQNRMTSTETKVMILLESLEKFEKRIETIGDKFIQACKENQNYINDQITNIEKKNNPLITIDKLITWFFLAANLFFILYKVVK